MCTFLRIVEAGIYEVCITVYNNNNNLGVLSNNYIY